MRIALVGLLAFAACEGPAGPAGPEGAGGPDGATGSQGSQGSQGSSGVPDPSPWLTADQVKVTVTDLTFDSTGAHVAFSLADGKGVPLDMSGKLTDGSVGVSFVLAQLADRPDGSPGQYTAYTTRIQTSPINGNSATQATTESVAANFAVVDVTQGAYTYTFAAPLTNLDSTLTQTVLAVARRTTMAGTAFDRMTFSARPDHGATIARELVTDATCDSCHRTLDAHGGQYVSPSQCILCHQPQSSDPDTGNTIDFKVMLHKIHAGSSLTFQPYQIIGYQQSVNDWSTVEFPQELNNCRKCHAGAQGDRWATNPGKAQCTSCHDNVSFDSTTPPAPYVAHSGGVQPTEQNCTVCHPMTGSIAGIADKHAFGLLAPNAPQVALDQLAIANTAPGQAPVVTFRAQLDGAPLNLSTTPLTRLTVTIAGNTQDESWTIQGRVLGTSAISPSALSAVDAANGIFQITLPATGTPCTNPLAGNAAIACALPVTATGTYEVGLEGYTQPVSGGPRYASFNPTLAFAVTDTTAQPRRQIVDTVTRCDNCHRSLAAHGGSRTNTAYCVFCHNTALQNGVALKEGQSVLGFTLDFRSMVHKIHAGENLAQGYKIGNSDFSDVRYPRALTECEACHTSKNWTLDAIASSAAYKPSQQTLYTCDPAAGSDSTVACPAASIITTPQPLQPVASVCTSCHDAPATLAHAQTNTTQTGVEACAACHGSGMLFDVANFHGTP